MKERINRLAKGIVDSELPKMVCTPEQIEETIRINSIAKRDIFVSSDNGLNVKGLVYSSDPRVKIPSDRNAFGGLRNHITYEIDTSFLSAGDEINGKFYLITNCGEKEIPYVFHVDIASSGKVLGGLETAEDFLHAAEQDMDTALRLLEYQEFTEAPFMQDMHVRAIYDGLKGRGNRQNFMEEFLIALRVKKPIQLSFDETRKYYENPGGQLEDFLTIRVDSWGYIYLEVSSDGDFIHLPKKSATQADFREGVLKLPFRILSERLHAGRNLGAVYITTAKGTRRIPIEACLTGGNRGAEEASYRKALKNYLNLRLDYESGTCEPSLVLNQMQKELDLMKITLDDVLLSLFQAEVDILSGRQDKASLILEEIKIKILSENQKRREVYCFYQYLRLMVWNEPEQKDTLIRLLQKYCSESGRKRNDFFLYLMLLRVNKELYENPGTILISMEQEFKDGCHSPFLYMECIKLLNGHPELLRGLSRFEAHVLYFGSKRRMVSRELAFRVARAADNTRSYRKFILQLLEILYGIYPERELLFSICTMLIKGDCRGEQYFSWYENGIKEGISLTRLYEYYLYSLPPGYNRQLPREVLLYFSYVSELDQYSKAVIFENILKYADRDSDVYRAYEREMEQFAMEKLFEEQIDSRLAVIYKNMLYKELIDRQLAVKLPSILRANRISCQDQMMRDVVVRHEELMSEDVYPLVEGNAYVPLFSDRDVIQFQDHYGNRYMSVSYEKVPVMEGVDELVEQCFAVYPEHPMLLINACYQAMEQEQLSEQEAAFLQQADQEMKLHPLFHRKIMASIIHFYKKRAELEEGGDRNNSLSYLLCLEKDSLTREEQKGVCETLIKQDYFAEAYDMICRYGLEGLSPRYLLKLCTKMVLQKLFDEDDRLLQLAYRVFQEEKSDSIILDYLCEHFNGTVDQMYQVLLQGIKEHVETYDLEERLLAQMLFTGNTDRIDRVFDFYASRKRTSELIVKAYFTVKCIGYFLNDEATEDKVFAYLEGAVNTSVEKDKVPDIYLLALTKYYSTLTELEEEQRELCQSVVDVLIEAGMIFSYFKDLARFISIPGNLLDKEIIEYHGRKDIKPHLKLRILPDETEFHYEEMRAIYKGIYIREKVLFEGEILEYQIWEEQEGDQEQKMVSNGCISCKEIVSRAPGNRFACLNEMSLSLDVKNENALREKMKEYLKKDTAVSFLFTLQ